MKSSNASSARSTRFNVGRAWFLSAFFASTAALCPTIFCSCESASQHSSSRGSNPYAQNEPKNAEEEAYYRDVYSGDWRSQINPFGTGPSVCKKTGSTTAPTHWSTVPQGAKSMDEIRFETAQRNAAQARRYAQAPTATLYGAPAQTPTPNVSQEPTPPQTPTIEYPSAQTVPTAPNVRYAAQVPNATPQYPRPYSEPASTPTTVGPQPAATQGPAPNVYPAPTTGAAVERRLFDNDAAIVRAQAPEEAAENDDEDPFADVEQADESDVEKPADNKNDDAADKPAGDAEPTAELTKENVKETSIAPQAVAPQAPAAQENAAPAPTGDGPSNRIGGKVLPLQIDPSIAKPFENVERPLANPSAPARPNGPRSTQNEYVVGGGDSKGEMFSRDDWSVENLDVEDSAAHFDAIDGRILSEPSNKVFLYSPRFGAVRQIVGPIEGESRVVLESANTTTQVAQDDGTQAVDVREQEEKLLGATNAVAVGASKSSSAAANATANQGVIEASSLVRLAAALTSDSIAELRSEEGALLLQGAIAAQRWSGEQKVAVALETANAFSNAYVEGAETIFSVKDDTKTSKLRLIKIANKDAARPGEFVEFTLRFENIGDKPIGNVTILDNLSARLAYVADSAKSSVPAEFLADLSDSGSLVLRWEITDPLEPGAFGVVRFICKVR